ncbi:MAG: AEC family transporter [Lachnospiraceae bacterium]|nr:AEC family transporter [Lachnospiraceae bacterium]
MLESFGIVGTQVLILFILIALGFALGKGKMLNDGGVKCINDIVIYVVNPCLIISAFQRQFETALLHGFINALIGGVIAHTVSLALAILVFRKQEEARRKVLRFASVFSNCGFMGIPLLNALLGDEGVFYGAAYLVVFNLVIWSYGQYIMAKGAKGFETKKIILNPGVIAVIIGLFFFFTSTALPEIILSPVNYLAGLNTPVPMLIIGYTMSKFRFRDLLGGLDEIKSYLVRLVASPLIVLAILFAIGMRGNVLIAVITLASAPTAALTTMFAIKYGCDEQLSARLVSTSTLLSVVTMTLIVGFTRFIA